MWPTSEPASLWPRAKPPPFPTWITITASRFSRLVSVALALPKIHSQEKDFFLNLSQIISLLCSKFCHGFAFQNKSQSSLKCLQGLYHRHSVLFPPSSPGTLTLLHSYWPPVVHVTCQAHCHLCSSAVPYASSSSLIQLTPFISYREAFPVCSSVTPFPTTGTLQHSSLLYFLPMALITLWLTIYLT